MIQKSYVGLTGLSREVYFKEVNDINDFEELKMELLGLSQDLSLQISQ